MVLDLISTGSYPGDRTGTTLPAAGGIINNNFLNISQSLANANASSSLYSSSLNNRITDVSSSLNNRITSISSSLASTINAKVPYKVYSAYITQTGANNPTISVLENTTGGTITWTRTASGSYQASSSNAAFTIDKCVPREEVFMDYYGNFYRLAYLSETAYNLYSYGMIDISTPADGVLNKRFVSIKIYN